MSINISIIIPTLHRKKSLLRLLDSISSQITARMEIIVVEQGDKNGNEYLRDAKKLKITLFYIFSNIHNTARAKNLGVKKAKGKFYIFFDDDIVVHRDCINNLVKNFSDPTIGCVAGRIITDGQEIDPKNTHTGRISPWSTFSDGFSSTIRQEVDTPVGCNMAFPKRIFLRAGGFDERFTAAIREESDLALRIKKLGYRVVYDPTAVVTHMREVSGGGRKTEGRMQWYYHFLSNETYFFLKHCNKLYFPVFLVTRMNWILRCMFGFGREVSVRSMITPFLGIKDGFRKYREVQL
ncbi:MAG TPA: glycosyltransferase [Patescibacteria group bacterium]|nr:glycosyltransferase [Patescibacteria group bacterium]